ncbi:MAG: acyltransferase [Sedimentisphaerales bacterium]|nr:acyltransferase [Sedimentisphaerales bacterium]MBN2843098.1 acyltransferase [Sedimentisphaerales bacterium]
MLKLVYNKIAKRLYLTKIKFTKGIFIDRKLRLRGIPIIDVRKGGVIYLGNDVTLNSDNRNYHLNMHSPVKLFADRPGATITIGSKTRIHGSCIHAYKSIRIGSRCGIAANCQIFDSNGHELSFDNVENRINTAGKSKPINIEDDVWIGANSIILPGVTIGKGSVIGAGSVVTRKIPSMCIAAGNPARVIKSIQ